MEYDTSFASDCVGCGAYNLKLNNSGLIDQAL